MSYIWFQKKSNLRQNIMSSFIHEICLVGIAWWVYWYKRDGYGVWGEKGGVADRWQEKIYCSYSIYYR